ncbi:MAG: HepT-like ribonuclease domain-containing protein [Solirubrobacterales bacterium]
MIGEPLTGENVLAALESRDPERRNYVGALERAVEKLVNFVSEIVDRGLREAGRAAHPSAKTTGKSFDRLREAGVISLRQRDRLVRLADVRNVIQHDYVEVRPQQIADAVEILRRNAHDVVRVLDAWVEEIDGATGKGWSKPPRKKRS